MDDHANLLICEEITLCKPADKHKHVIFSHCWSESNSVALIIDPSSSRVYIKVILPPLHSYISVDFEP